MKQLAVDAILFDFDGVLVDSEYVGNVQIARTLTDLGHPTSEATAIEKFMGLSGRDFLAAIEGWIGGPIPPGFQEARRAEDERVLAEGLDAVAGAIDFVARLPAELPRAIVSSSSTRWIARHLEHLGLLEAFGDKIFSGREHVARGKPAPDLYWLAADSLGVDIARNLVIEDSPVGVEGALASGAQVVGLCAGRHCSPGHADRLRAKGARWIVGSFDEIAERL